MSPENYNLATIILWSLTLVAGFATAIIYFFQLRAMQNAVRAQNLAGLIQYLQSPDVRRARHVILNQLKGTPYVGGDRVWSALAEEDAATACAAYVVAGIFVQLNRVDRDIIIAN